MHALTCVLSAPHPPAALRHALGCALGLLSGTAPAGRTARLPPAPLALSSALPCSWLEEFLKSWDRTVVIVSHDRSFLNSVTTQTVFLHRKRLWYYGGSYDTFLKALPAALVPQHPNAFQYPRATAS